MVSHALVREKESLILRHVDIVGISDQDTWEYSEELLKMAANHGYKGIKLLRAMDILGLTAGKPMTRELYMELAPVTRKAILEQYGRTEEEIRKLIIDDFDSNMTYRGFIRFLESDLRYSPVAKDAKSGHKYRKIAKAVAGRMMIRAEVSAWITSIDPNVDKEIVFHQAAPSRM